MEAPGNNHEDTDDKKNEEENEVRLPRIVGGNFLLRNAISVVSPLRAFWDLSEKCRSVFSRARFSEILHASNSL